MSLQPKPANVWLEPSTVTASLPTPAFLQKDGSGDWTLATSGPKDGALVDMLGDGDYVILDLTDEQSLVADGSDIGLADIGTADAIRIIVDDSGDEAFSTDFSLTPSARIVHDTAGDVVLYRDASPELAIALVGTDYLCFEDS